MAVATRDLGHAGHAGHAAPTGQRRRGAGPRTCACSQAGVGRPRLRLVHGSERSVRPNRAVYLRRRLVVGAVILGLVATGVWAVGVATADPGPVAERRPPPVAFEEVPVRGGDELVVGRGDTLWDLVGPLAPSGESRHAWIARVVEENDLDPLRLEPGTVVRLPSP